jgi:transcriptional regulator
MAPATSKAVMMLYLPELFAERDPAALHAFLDDNAFATLISPDPIDPHITHVPLLLERGRGASGALLGHMARANPHWRRLEAQPDVLAVFHGPHAYVSPSWYAAHPSVPTWNYAVVHVHGNARLMHESRDLEALVRRLVERHEGPRPQPWRMELPADYQAGMLQGIVGFEIEITAITGKFKLSQNRPAVDRERVAAALASGSPGEQDVANLMRRRKG